MINIIYGAKGAGKTKKIIDAANDSLQVAKGNIVFLTDTDRYSPQINYQIRFINTKDYEIKTEMGLYGFIRGLIAGNTDIEYVYIDGAARMANLPLEEMGGLYDMIGQLSQKFNINFCLTVSADENDIPDFIKKYL